MELIRRRKARKALIDFTEYTTPNWKPGRIHREICEALDAVSRKEIDRLLLLCPPQHGKSTVTSKRFPAYQLGKNPELEIISASASHLLAEDFGSAVRGCVRDPAYSQLFPAVQLSEDTSAKGRWMTTDGGGYYAVGVGGDLYGRGGHLGLIDDPFGSWEDAQSELMRKKVWDWYTGTFYNRIRPGGAIVVIQHRMHEDDLVGLLLQHEQNGGDRWKIVNIPADLDNPPWPERYNREALERLKIGSSLRKWNALYMQDPTPDDGVYFKRENLRLYRDTPSELNIVITGDFAVSHEAGDFTSIIVWGVDNRKNCYALATWTGQKTVDVWINALLDLVEEYRPTVFVAEMGVIRKAIEPFLRDAMVSRGIFVRCEWLPSHKEKTALATTFQGLTEMGRIYFPMTQWAESIINNLVKFPGGRYDDDVDACSLFGRYIADIWKANAPDPSPGSLTDAWNAPLTIGDVIHG